ncbi:MAG TPA: hypothetical protein VKX17_08340 [Planctomycetota bacterium]|nr:hypothetical protein [Planctomycetota bacterium]
MEFIPAGELISNKHQIRSITLRGHSKAMDGDYTFVDTYCTDEECDCRKAMIQVLRNGTLVSIINFGWEPLEFYKKWYGKAGSHSDAVEFKGPAIDISSPDLVDPNEALKLFVRLLDERLDYELNQFPKL